MTEQTRDPIRVLIVDDEEIIRDAYRQILCQSVTTSSEVAVRDLRARLFNKPPLSGEPGGQRTPGRTFDAVFCDQAELAVAEVRKSLAQNLPFALVFLDMRMPPGKDGIWAAARIRELDPAVEIVICTAYSDVDPAEVAAIVPPEEKLSYLQKPFHPHEVRQLTIALASKWEAERRIVRLAYFDSLTGLPNREQSKTRLVSAIAAARERSYHLAVLYLDLDNFKRVNDTLGHAAGDDLLCKVAGRLADALRCEEPPDSDFDAFYVCPADLARLGGDEFLVLLPNIPDPDTASSVAQRLITVLREPIPIASSALVVTASIGIAVYPGHGSDAQSLMRNADLAMYFAKRRGGGNHA